MADSCGSRYSLSARAQIVTLKAAGKTNNEITSAFGISRRQVQLFYSNAIKRGWDPTQLSKDEHLEDAPRSGRPKKVASVVPVEDGAAIAEEAAAGAVEDGSAGDEVTVEQVQTSITALEISR